jgi:excisionase family DNA binding protein
MSAPLDEADPWLTLAEIAAELRMHPATIRLWISRGHLNATRPGRRKLLVRRSELDRMLAEPGAKRPGQLRVELPAKLHAALLAEARSQGVCANTLAVALLAGGINWRSRYCARPLSKES